MKFTFLILMVQVLVYGNSWAQDAGSKIMIEQEMLQDIAILEENLFLTHIDVDRYHSKEELRSTFEGIRKSVAGKQLHPVEFYRELLPVLPVIANGHTDISPPASYFDSLRLKTLRFPYDLYVDNDEVYILRDNSAEQFLGEGTRLRTINGVEVLECIRDMASLISRDGYNKSLPMLGATASFKSYYAFFLGCPEVFEIAYFDEFDEEQSYTLKGETLEGLATYRKERYNNVAVRWGEKGYKACDLEIEGKTAIMTINTFSSGEIKKFDGCSYKRFFKESFEIIEEKGVEDLIIDLRWNGGGDPKPTIDLFSYMHPESFVFYRKVTTQVNKIPNRKLYNKSQFFFNLIAPLRVRKGKDGIYYAKNVPGLSLCEPKKEVYTGNAYVLISPASYSATGEMASCFKQHNRVTFIGEETGGNPNVNVSGFMPILILPNSKVQVTLPLVRFEMAVDFDADGRGIIPDYEVKASIADMLAGRDAVMEYTLRLIREAGANQ